MSLIGRLVGKLLTKGSITLHARQAAAHLSARAVASTSPSASPTARSRSTSSATRGSASAKPIWTGGSIIEDGTILDLLDLVVGANRWEDGGEGRKAHVQGQECGCWRAASAAINPKRARRNVAHHYDLERRALRTLPRRRPAI